MAKNYKVATERGALDSWDLWFQELELKLGAETTGRAMNEHAPWCRASVRLARLKLDQEEVMVAETETQWCGAYLWLLAECGDAKETCKGVEFEFGRGLETFRVSLRTASELAIGVEVSP